MARPGDPLVTADGHTVAPEVLPGANVAEDTSPLSARNFRPTKKRTLKELPATPEMVKAVACVFMYTVLGVGDREIATALGITPSMLVTIRKNPAYMECFNNVLDEFISVHSNLINARLAAYGETAVDNIMGLAQHAKKEEVKLRANIDVADRAGISTKNKERSGMLNDLHITIISAGKEQDIRIDMGSHEPV